jgi:general secretion pathway protein H
LIKPSARGFTLVEVLVVIVIIGSLVGLVVFTVGNKPNKNQIERESMRLQSILHWVQNEALFQNNEWGMDVKKDRYIFYRLNNKKQWEKVDDIKDADKTELRELFEHELPSHMWIKTQIEGSDKWTVEDSEQSVSDRPGLSSDKPNTTRLKAPPILILSSGEYTPFIIDMGLEQDSKPLFSIYGDGVADIRVVHGDDIEKIHCP